MSQQLRTLQNLLILNPQDFSLDSYNDKINRRLAALANLGQRYGQEGKGFYIKNLQLKDIFQIAIEDSIESEKELLIDLSNQHSSSEDITLAYPVNIVSDTAGIKLKTFYSKLFSYVALFIFDRYIPAANEASNVEQQMIQATYGVGESDPSTSISSIAKVILKLPLDYKFDVIFDSTTDTPIAFSSPLLLTSDIFYFENAKNKLCPLFQALFTIAVIIQNVSFEDDVYGNFDVYEYGLGICADGTVLFNQTRTGISLQGSLGITNQFILASAEFVPLNEVEGTVKDFYISSMYGEFKTSDSATIQANTLQTVCTDLKGNQLVIVGPSSNLFVNLPQNYLKKPLQNGDILFSFVVLSNDDTNNIFYTDVSGDSKRICTSISFWQNNQWIPLRQASDTDNNYGAFSFTDLISTTTIQKNIMANIQEIIGGYKEDVSARYLIPDYFRHRSIFFERINNRISSNNQNDNFLTHADTYFFVTTKSYNGNSESIPVLSLGYQEADKTLGNVTSFEDWLFQGERMSQVDGMNLSELAEVNAGDARELNVPYLNTQNIGIYQPRVIDRTITWQVNKTLVPVYSLEKEEKNKYSFSSEAGGQYLKINAWKHISATGRITIAEKPWTLFGVSSHLLGINPEEDIYLNLSVIEQEAPSSTYYQKSYGVLHVRNFSRINLEPSKYEITTEEPGEINIGGTVKFYEAGSSTDPTDLTSKVPDNISLSHKGIFVKYLETDKNSQQVNITPESGLRVVQNVKNEDQIWEEAWTVHTPQGLAGADSILFTLNGSKASLFLRIPVLPKYFQSIEIKNALAHPVLELNPQYEKPADYPRAFWYYGFTQNYLDFMKFPEGLLEPGKAELKSVYVEYLGQKYLIDLKLLYDNGILTSQDFLLTDTKDSQKNYNQDNKKLTFTSALIMEVYAGKAANPVTTQVLYGFYLPFINNTPAFTFQEPFKLNTIKKIKELKNNLYICSIPPYPVIFWSGQTDPDNLYDCLKQKEHSAFKN